MQDSEHNRLVEKVKRQKNSQNILHRSIKGGTVGEFIKDEYCS
jgi:hypothetical protein